MPNSTAFDRALGITWKNRALLNEALTHPSRGGTVHYQRLEFLGDRVLGLVIADWLYAHYPDEPEGLLNRRLSGLVRTESLAGVAQQIDLGEHILLDPGARGEQTHKKPTVLADVMEAAIGAAFLDQGYAVARDMVLRLFAERLDADPTAAKDAKTQLQEWAQARGLGLPSYREVGRAGPDHAPRFTIEVCVQGYTPARAEGQAKKSTEQAAAQALLDREAGKGA